MTSCEKCQRACEAERARKVERVLGRTGKCLRCWGTGFIVPMSACEIRIGCPECGGTGTRG